MKKYTLPEVEKLKETGLKFEFNTIDEFFRYAEIFVQEFDDELLKILIKDFDIEYYEETVKLNTCLYLQIRRADEKIKRLGNGTIEKDDYRYVVHPVHKDNLQVLISAWVKRKMKFGLDSESVLYYPKAFDIDPLSAIHLTLLNELYRQIILKLPIESFESIKEKEKCPFQPQINTLEQKLHSLSAKNKLLSVAIKHNIEKVKEAKYEDFFSKRMSTSEKASMFARRIWTKYEFYEYHEVTNLEDKELVIRHFLKEQSPAVQKSKNSRGKGLQIAKRKMIIQYCHDNPDANNSQVSLALKVSRNTVRKYRPG